MKKYSKLIALATVLVIAISVTVLVVYLNSIEKGTNFKLGEYTVISQGAGVAIVSYDGEDTTLTIPAKIEGKKIVAVKKAALNESQVVKLSFEEGANIELEEGAFANNTILQEVTLPTTATFIPKNCFMGCTSLNKVTMPDSITYIGDYAFAECTNLTKNYEKAEDTYRWLELPKSLKEVCDHAFYNCTQLDAIRVTDKLELIDNSAFRSSGLQRIEMYDEEATLAIQEIGDYAFYSTFITSNSSDKLNLPALKKIGAYAFASTSTNFKSFSVPSSVTSIGEYAFSGSANLAEIIFETDDDAEDLTIGKYALSACLALESVNFKRSVKEIPEGMFMGCIRLLYKQNLTLPEEVETIGPGAFALFVTPSSNTKYCNYTVNFKRMVGEEETLVSYNNNFKVTQLTDYYASSSTSLSSKHFVITEYFGSDIQGHSKPQELYAYVGLYSTTSQWKLDNKDAYAFKFLLDSQFSELKTIKNSAFAGAMFDKLCLPGSATTFEKNSLYQSSITAIYIDGGCLNTTCDINSEAFSNMKTSLSDLVVFIKGTSSQRSAYEASVIKTQLNAISNDLCRFTTEAWPK